MVVVVVVIIIMFIYVAHNIIIKMLYALKKPMIKKTNYFCMALLHKIFFGINCNDSGLLCIICAYDQLVQLIIIKYICTSIYINSSTSVWSTLQLVISILVSLDIVVISIYKLIIIRHLFRDKIPGWMKHAACRSM